MAATISRSPLSEAKLLLESAKPATDAAPTPEKSQKAGFGRSPPRTTPKTAVASGTRPMNTIECAQVPSGETDSRVAESAVTESSGTVTRTESVMAAIRRRVASRALTSGEKLPSIRQFARDMRVSPSTVVEAYDRLAAEGLIRSRAGSGFYVAGSPPPLALTDVAPKLDRAIDPFWVSRQSLDAGPAILRPGCGW